MSYRVRPSPSPTKEKHMGGAPGVPNTSRRLLATTAHEESFNLREVARKWCPKAVAVVAKALERTSECACWPPR
jgi:hypothetical protein